MLSTIAAFLVKQLPSFLFKTVWESIKVLLLQLPWQALVERFTVRLMLAGLKVLKSLSTNDVYQHTIDDFIKLMSNRKLAVIDGKAN